MAAALPEGKKVALRGVDITVTWETGIAPEHVDLGLASVPFTDWKTAIEVTGPAFRCLRMPPSAYFFDV